MAILDVISALDDLRTIVEKRALDQSPLGAVKLLDGAAPGRVAPIPLALDEIDDTELAVVNGIDLLGGETLVVVDLAVEGRQAVVPVLAIIGIPLPEREAVIIVLVNLAYQSSIRIECLSIRCPGLAQAIGAHIPGTGHACAIGLEYRLAHQSAYDGAALDESLDPGGVLGAGPPADPALGAVAAIDIVGNVGVRLRHVVQFGNAHLTIGETEEFHVGQIGAVG